MDRSVPKEMEDLWRRLSERRERLRQLRKRLKTLQKDYEHRANGGCIYYAVDWSELRCFLSDEAGEVEVGFHQSREERDPLVRLALNHLFSTFSSKLYLLPAHASEMWTFVRSESQRALERHQKLHEQALMRVKQLPERHQQTINLLASDAVVSAAQLDELIDLVKRDFEDLCDQILTFDALRENLFARLRRLFHERKLSYSVEIFLEELGASPNVLEFSTEEIDKVFDRIPRKSPVPRRIDAIAALQLRAVNRAAAKHGDYMVLATRDQSLRDGATNLEREPWFGWTTFREHFRHIETIFLDLALQGTASPDEAHLWIVEMEHRFGKLQQAIDSLLNRSPSTASSFVVEGSAVLEEVQRVWHEHVNLRLSLVRAKVPWLAEAASALPPVLDKQAALSGKGDAHRQIALIRRLCEFVQANPGYQKRAREDIEETWLALHDEAFRLLFLGDVRADGTHIAQTLRGRTERGQTVLHSLRDGIYNAIGSLQFVSYTYQKLLGELQRQTEGGQAQPLKIREAFLQLVRAATTQPREAEGFLFMAFLLGVLHRWDVARDLAERSLTLPGHKRIYEIEYFLAIAHRRLATITDRPKLCEYVAAYRSIMKAIELKRSETNLQDARYLKERGTIVLAYHEALAGDHDPTAIETTSSSLHPGKVDQAKAVGFLEQALGHVKADDRALRVEILNNLAYAAIQNGDLDTAERYVGKLDAEFDPARRYPGLPKQPWGAVLDTKALVAAHRARRNRDVAALHMYADQLQAIQDALDGDKRRIQKHADEVRCWILELSRRS